MATDFPGFGPGASARMVGIDRDRALDYNADGLLVSIELLNVSRGVSLDDLPEAGVVRLALSLLTVRRPSSWGYVERRAPAYNRHMATDRIVVDLGPDEQARLSAESRRRGVGAHAVIVDLVRALPRPDATRRSLEALARLRASRVETPEISEADIEAALSASRTELERRAVPDLDGWWRSSWTPACWCGWRRTMSGRRRSMRRSPPGPPPARNFTRPTSCSTRSRTV